MIRLFVIEDHKIMVVSSLKYLFHPRRDEIIIAGSSSTIDDTIVKADPSKFDLFLLDLYIPGHKPIDNIRKLKEVFPGKPIAIYTTEKSNSWKQRMMDEGANVYITKDASREELKLGIQKAAQGEFFCFGNVEERNTGQVDDEVILTMQSTSPILNEIVKMLSNGLTHKEISTQIGISRSLTEKILKDARKKFQVKNNLELVKLFILLGNF